MKKNPILKLKKYLTKFSKEYIRLRDKDTCQHCGKHIEGVNRHVSHVIPKSHGNILRWDKENLKLLCFYCHMNWWHKNPMEAADWFKSKFPERWEYLQLVKEKTLKLTKENLENMVAIYKEDIKNLEILE